MANRVVQLRNIKRALRVEPSDAVSYIVSGRVSNFRRYRSVNFIDLIDGSSKDHLQVVVKRDLLKKPEIGSYLTCQGQISPSLGPQQAIEFKVEQVKYLSRCVPEKYPMTEIANRLDKNASSWLRNNIHLRPRASHFESMLRVRSELELSMHMILKQMDFFKVHTPILTANDSEASSDLFMVQRSKQLRGSEGFSNGDGHGDSEQHSDSESDSESDVDPRPKGNDGDVRDPPLSLSSLSASSSPSAAVVEAATKIHQQQKRRILTGGYFGEQKEVFMITSAQLHLECLAASLSRVYCLGPTFRAESSLSRRHLCEFTMLEAEESNLSNLEPLMDRVESMVKFSAQYLGEISEFKSDFSTLLDKYSNDRVYQKLVGSRFIRMTYDEAVAILQKLSASNPENPNCQHGCDINRWHERQLLEYCDQVPIFITNYPRSLKPFYMKACVENAQKVENFDLIAPTGGEICGGSLREDDLETLRKNLRDMHENKYSQAQASKSKNNEPQDRDWDGTRDPFAWYLELREFGTFPHGGFGIGFERLIQSLLGVKNIRDTIAFPRWRGKCEM